MVATASISMISHSNRFMQNEANRNGFNGFELDRSNNNTFDGNIANNNGTTDERSGFSLDNATGNSLTENTSNNNSRNGFRLDNSFDNVLIGNLASGNQGRDRGGVVDGADCKQLASARNRFLENDFSNPDDCETFAPPD